jgi:hypothetical protein
MWRRSQLRNRFTYPSTLNLTVAKKGEIQEQTDKCGKSCKKGKTRRVSTFRELEHVLMAWYLQARASGISVDGNILHEKAKEIAYKM